MTPERIAELRAQTPLVHGTVVVEWIEMLDEIERLQEATRWHDPAVDSPQPA